MKKIIALLLLFVPLLVIGQEKEMSIFRRDTLNGRVRMMCKYFVQGSYVDTLCEVDDGMLDRKVCFDSLGRCVEDYLYFSSDDYSLSRIWYDENGRDTLAINSDKDGLTSKSRMKYDESGNELRCERYNCLHLAEDGHVRFVMDWKEEFEYEVGKMIGSRHYSNAGLVNRTEIKYDDQGRLTSDVQYGREGDTIKRTENEYDDQGRLVSELYFRSENFLEKKTYEYDERGNLIKKLQSNFFDDDWHNFPTSYQYDSLGRVTEKLYYHTPYCSLCFDSVRYSYNEDGRLNEVFTRYWVFDSWEENYDKCCSTDEKVVLLYDEKGVLRKETRTCISEHCWDELPASWENEIVYNEKGLETEELQWYDGVMVGRKRYFYDEKDNLIRFEKANYKHPEFSMLIVRKIEYY